MRGRGIGGHTLPGRGRTNEWYTPPEVVAALGPFDLDPCSPARFSDLPACGARYTSEDDGLAKPWFGRVWLNPPYGPDLDRWLAKMAAHGRGTAITFARTETRTFHRYVWGVASGVFFFKGRLHFYTQAGVRAKGNAGGPSVLIAYGSSDASRLARCGLPGYYVSLSGS